MNIVGHGLSVRFSHTQILHEVDFLAKEGKTTVIIGPNGSGKSTLLRTLLGYITPIKGYVSWGDDKLSDISMKERAKRVAFLPQSTDIIKDMTVEELVQCGRYPHRHWWEKSSKRDLEVVLDVLSMQHLLDKKYQLVETLSGGERQRVWIAMALAQEADTLVLDEVTTYLDVAHQIEVLSCLKQLQKEKEFTLVMVLHDLQQALFMADSMVVMQSGHIIAEGEPRSLFQEGIVDRVFGIRTTLEEEFLKIHGLQC